MADAVRARSTASGDIRPRLSSIDITRRLLTRLLAFDLIGASGMVLIWTALDFVDPRVAIPTMILRAGLWVVSLFVLVAPIQACQRQGEAANSESLLAADEAIRQLARRFTIHYAIGWLGMHLLWIALGTAAAPVGLDYDTIEVLLALMLMLASTPAVSLIHFLVDSTTLDARAALGTTLVERAITVPRAPRSLTRPMTATMLHALACTLLAAATISIHFNARSQRQLALVEQLGGAELSAERVASGRGVALDGVEIVARDQLPDAIVAVTRADDPRAPTSVSTHDRQRDLVLAAAPLGDGRWTLSSTSTSIDRITIELAGLILLLSLIALPLVGLAMVAFGRSVSTPLEQFGEAAGRFVEHGELRALERIVPLQNDPIGRLAAKFNAMLDILEELAHAAQSVSDGDLTTNLEHPGELHDAFRSMLGQLNHIVARLRETSLELASAAAEIDALIRQQEQATQAQSANIQQLSETVGSLAAAAQQIAAATDDVREVAEEAVATTAMMAQSIIALRGETASIAELLQLIHEIAERSDLLALNGSLEATRAGEAGRGFALVASEMRRLAERVTNTVEGVRERVSQIESAGAGAVRATDANREIAQRTAVAAAGISKVTAEQSAATDQASSRVQLIVDGVTRSSAAMSQTRAAAEGLRAHAAELERLIASFALREPEPPERAELPDTHDML